MANNLRFIQARAVRVGDFYMEGFVNGKPVGLNFKVESVETKAIFMNRVRIRGADQFAVAEIDPTQITIVEREPHRRR